MLSPVTAREYERTLRVDIAPSALGKLKAPDVTWGDIHSEAAAGFVLLRALPGSAVAPKTRRKRSAPRWRIGGVGSAFRIIRAAVLPS
jgi:hypothetical protein